MNWTYIIVIAAYLAAMAAVAFRGHRRSASEEEFLTASRSIGPWIGGATLAATQISAGTFVGTLGQHYWTGVGFIWAWFGMWGGWFLCAAFVAPKLQESGALTIPDYIGRRYQSVIARVISALLIVFAYTILLSAQYQAAGEVFRATFGLSPIVPMLLILVSTVLYTLVGGVRTGSYIDMLQTLAMILGLAVGVPLLIYEAGGLQTAGQFLAQLDSRLVGSYYTPGQLVAFGLAFGLSISTSPYELARFYSMRDAKTARYAVGVSIFFQFLIGSAIMILGLMMRVIFPHLTSPDQASAVMAFEVLPPLAGALFLVAIFSAVMSTCSSILIVAGSGLAHDVYGNWLAPKLGWRHDSRFLVLLNRTAVVAVGLLPLYLALHKFEIVQFIVLEAAKFIASMFFAAVVFGLNWRGATAQGAIGGMLSGFLVTWIWSKPFGWNSSLPPFLAQIDSAEVGVVVSSLVFFAVSRMTAVRKQYEYASKG
jgi:SSS family transporter